MESALLMETEDRKTGSWRQSVRADRCFPSLASIRGELFTIREDVGAS